MLARMRTFVKVRGHHVKWALLASILWSAQSIAHTQGEALRSRDEIFRALKDFNPATVLKGFTANPHESKLGSKEGGSALSAQGLNAVNNQGVAQDIYQQAGNRAKVQFNARSKEMEYAEQLLEHSARVLEGQCYTLPKVCNNQTEVKQCEESVIHLSRSCKDSLQVSIKPITQNFNRRVSISKTHVVSFNLYSCGATDMRCSAENAARRNANCEFLAVSVSRKNNSVLITKQPTCADPTISIKLSGGLSRSASLLVTLTEYLSEMQWSTQECQQFHSNQANAHCVLEGSATCIEPNQTKTLGGLSIQRPCWGREYQYSCTRIHQSNCFSLINQGCFQIASTCIAAHSNRCLRYSQTFSCLKEVCQAEQTICPGKMGCSDGQCDLSQSETSEDMAEGLSRLGALASGAGEVRAQQVQSDTPAIFSGTPKECKKYPLGLRDCCTDSGWGDWVKHCPADLQEFQRAKQENRVVYLGGYKNHKLGARHYTYCVFPTKLAAIVQIQGRGQQLNISYGTAELPNCRGITPQELERINFSALDLTPIQQDFMKHIQLPNKESIYNANQAHIKHLNEVGLAHD